MNSLFFFFSKILTILIFPMSLFFLFGLTTVLLIQGFRAKLIVFFLLSFLYLFSNAYIATSLINSLESAYEPVSIGTLPKSDVVVVLGGMIQTLGKYGTRPELTESSDRLVDAIRIYKAGKAKKILFTGGSGYLFADEIREADLAKQIITELGVPEKDLVIERESHNTYENAVFSKQLIEENHFETIILVTSAFHFKRAAATFKKQNLTFTSFPTDFRAPNLQSKAFELWIPSGGFLEMSTLAIKEWIGYIAYDFKDYL